MNGKTSKARRAPSDGPPVGPNAPMGNSNTAMAENDQLQLCFLTPVVACFLFSSDQETGAFRFPSFRWKHVGNSGSEAVGGESSRRDASRSSPRHAAWGSSSATIADSSPSYSAAGETERVPSPARKTTMTTINVVARLKANACASLRDIEPAPERRTIPPLTGARRVRPMAAITAKAKP